MRFTGMPAIVRDAVVMNAVAERLSANKEDRPCTSDMVTERLRSLTERFELATVEGASPDTLADILVELASQALWGCSDLYLPEVKEGWPHAN